jgi:hypothetical protein
MYFSGHYDYVTSVVDQCTINEEGFLVMDCLEKDVSVMTQVPPNFLDLNFVENQDLEGVKGAKGVVEINVASAEGLEKGDWIGGDVKVSMVFRGDDSSRSDTNFDARSKMMGGGIGSDRSIVQGGSGSNWNKDPHKMSVFAVNAGGVASTRSVKRASSKLIANLEITVPKVVAQPVGRQSLFSRKGTLEDVNKLPRLSAPGPFGDLDKNGAGKTFNFSGGNHGDPSKDERKTLEPNSHLKPDGLNVNTRQARRDSINQARKTSIPAALANDPLNPKSTDPKNRTCNLGPRRKNTVKGDGKRSDGYNTLTMNL